MSVTPPRPRSLTTAAAIAALLLSTSGCTFTFGRAESFRAMPRHAPRALLASRDLPRAAIAAATGPGSTIDRARRVGEALEGWAPLLYSKSHRFVPMPSAAFSVEPWSAAAEQVIATGRSGKHEHTSHSPARVLYLMGAEAYAQGHAALDPDERDHAFTLAQERWTKVLSAENRDAACGNTCLEQLHSAAAVALHFLQVQLLPGDGEPRRAWLSSLDATFARAADAGALDHTERLQLRAMIASRTGAAAARPPAAGEASVAERRFLAAIRLVELKGGAGVSQRELPKLLDLVRLSAPRE